MVPDSRAPLRADRLRALNVPRPVEVQLDDRRPVAIRDAACAGTTHPWVAVEAVLETWQIEDEWWRLPIARHYVEALLAGGARVVLFLDQTSGAWFVQLP
jgi:hypothetical protein